MGSSISYTRFFYFHLFLFVVNPFKKYLFNLLYYILYIHNIFLLLLVSCFVKIKYTNMAAFCLVYAADQSFLNWRFAPGPAIFIFSCFFFLSLYLLLFFGLIIFIWTFPIVLIRIYCCRFANDANHSFQRN